MDFQRISSSRFEFLEIHQKSLSLFFIVETIEGVINLGISESLKYLNTKYQKVVSSVDIAMNTVKDLNSLKKLIDSQKLEDFQTLDSLVNFLSINPTKKKNVILFKVNPRYFWFSDIRIQSPESLSPSRII
jgi:hypothetical protein